MDICLKIMNVTNWLCIPPNKYNMTLQSVNNDLLNGWTTLNLYVNKCNQKIQKCQNSTYSDKVLQTFVVGLVSLSN